MHKTLALESGGALRGRISIPGDKSISHRALMLTAIANGTSHIRHFLFGEDNLATLAALQALGATIKIKNETELEVMGAGKHGLHAASHPLDMGNAGTGMRLLTGLLAGQRFSSTLVGDASLQQRPMDRIIQPLAHMGANITARKQRFAPLQIQAANLTSINYTLPIASAQIKSCLLLAGLYAEGTTRIHEPLPARDHTERLLQYLNYPCTVIHHTNGNSIELIGQAELSANTTTIPGDFSSAAFFIVGALIAPHSDLIIENVGLNPTRTGLLTLLKSMGASIEIMEQQNINNEPLGTLRVRTSELHGITVPPELVPLAIDEFPIFFIAAACAQGDTLLQHAAELRVKESDRLAVMAEGLTTLGIENQLFNDGIQIRGGTLMGGMIDAHHDHRIAMAFAIASLRSNKPIHLKHYEKIATSFPNFMTLFNQIKE